MSSSSGVQELAKHISFNLDLASQKARPVSSDHVTHPYLYLRVSVYAREFHDRFPVLGPKARAELLSFNPTFTMISTAHSVT